MLGQGSPRAGRGEQDLDREILGLISRGAVPIPPYPAVALRVQEVVSRKDFGLTEVAHLVNSDPALAADVLRCANSAIYRRGGPVTNLAWAITRVGAREVMRLALSSGLAAHAQASSPLAALKRIVWIESLASAVVCQELARLRGLRTEEAYVLGLLHDFGKVVGSCCLESILGKDPVAGTRPAGAWAEVVERHHVALGLEMAERWGLPALVKGIISDHHGDAAGECQDPGLLEVVKASDRIVALLARRAQVTALELAGVPALAVAEREAIASMVGKIPEFVASFEAAPEPSHAAPASLVSPPDATLAPGERVASFGVSVTIARRVREYTARSISENGLVMVGKEPLPENRVLVEASIQAQPGPFTMWALVRLSQPERDAVRIELQPYALSSDTRRLWNELLAAGARDA